MDRRGFLQGILAAGVAPAVVGSGILMPIRQLWRPKFSVQQMSLTLEEFDGGAHVQIVRGAAKSSTLFVPNGGRLYIPPDVTKVHLHIVGGGGGGGGGDR